MVYYGLWFLGTLTLLVKRLMEKGNSDGYSRRGIRVYLWATGACL